MKKPRKITQRDLIKKVRKPLPPPTMVINPKKKYDRRDKSWRDEGDKS